MSDIHQGNPGGAETAKLLLKTGVRIDDAEQAVACATALAGLARYVPKQFRTLISLAQGLDVSPEELEVPAGQVFPYFEEGKLDPLAKVILLAGLNTPNSPRFEIEDPFDMSDEATSKLVTELGDKFDEKASRLLSALGTKGKSGRRGRG